MTRRLPTRHQIIISLMLHTALIDKQEIEHRGDVAALPRKLGAVTDLSPTVVIQRGNVLLRKAGLTLFRRGRKKP
jgi:hypothetical protein